MATSPGLPSLLTGSVGLTAVALTTVPSVRRIALRFFQKPEQQPEDNGILQLGKTVYQDEDGSATEESLREFSDRWQKTAIALLSILGFFGALALAVVTPSHARYFVLFWFQFGVWVSIFVTRISSHITLIVCVLLYEGASGYPSPFLLRRTVADRAVYLGMRCFREQYICTFDPLY